MKLTKEDKKELKHLLFMIGNCKPDWLNWRVIQEQSLKYEKMIK